MAFKIGIVGCGAVASYLHAPAIVKSSNFDLVSVFDSNLERAEALAAEFGVKKFGQSLEDGVGELDAVVVATPPHAHLSAVSQALDYGMHVLIEKPLASTVAECEQIARAAKERGKIAAVCHQYRFWPNRMRIQQLFSSGQLAMPKLVTVSLGNPYTWNSVSGYTVRRELVSGGVLINAGIHPLDTLISWFGDPLDIEYFDDACGGLESNVRISMKFQGQVMCQFRMSRTCRLENCFQLHWDSSVITLSNSDPYQYVVDSADNKKSKVLCENTGRNGYLGPATDLYDDFAHSISEDCPTRVDAYEATRVIKLIEGCYQQKNERVLPVVAPIPGITW